MGRWQADIGGLRLGNNNTNVAKDTQECVQVQFLQGQKKYLFTDYMLNIVLLDIISCLYILLHFIFLVSL